MGKVITKDTVITHYSTGQKMSPLGSKMVTAFAQNLRKASEKAYQEKHGKIPMLNKK